MSSHGKFQKYNKYKTEMVFPHKHCSVCNRMVSEEENEFGEFCSADCAGSKKLNKKKSKKKYIYMFVGYGIMIGIFLIVMNYL